MQTYTKKDLRAIGLTVLAVTIILGQALFIATSLHRLETASKVKNHGGIVLVGDCPGGGGTNC